MSTPEHIYEEITEPDADYIGRGMSRLNAIKPILAEYVQHPDVVAHVANLQTTSFPGDGKEPPVVRWKMVMGMYDLLGPEKTRQQVDVIDAALTSGIPTDEATCVQLTKANQTLLLSNLRYVFRTAKPYLSHPLIPAEDILQEGVSGLQYGICCHNPSKGGFLNGVTWPIKNAIIEGINAQRRMIYFPDNAVVDQRHISAARHTFAATTGRVPSDKEVSTATGIPQEQIRRIDNASSADRLSLDYPMDESGDTTLGDSLEAEGANPQDQTDVIFAKQQIKRVFTDKTSELTDEQKFVLAIRFDLLSALDGIKEYMEVYIKGECVDHNDVINAIRKNEEESLSYARIGDYLNVSESTVQKIATSGLKRARALLERPVYPEYPQLNTYADPYDMFLPPYGTHYDGLGMPDGADLLGPIENHLYRPYSDDRM